MSKRNAAIYREAARIVAESRWEYSCWAILVAKGYRSDDKSKLYSDPHIGKFTKLFSEEIEAYQDEAWLENADHPPTEFYEWRILALLFMAAIEESE